MRREQIGGCLAAGLAGAFLALALWYSPALILAVAGVHAEQTEKPRLSGNCGPAAQGLTPVGDVVPIKVDFAGHVIVAVP